VYTIYSYIILTDYYMAVVAGCFVKGEIKKSK